MGTGWASEHRTVLGVVVLALVVAVGALTPTPARAGDGWSVTRTDFYKMGDVGPLTNTVSLGTAPCWSDTGSVCFGRTVGDTFAVRITDDSGRKVGGVINIERDGWTVFSRPFCGKSGALPVVAGELTVFVDAPGDVRGVHWFGGPGCTEISPLGTTTGATTQGATSGRVQVTFTGNDR